jgi:hypothetical protein
MPVRILYVVIVLLAATVVGLVVVGNKSEAKGPATHGEGPPAQSHAKKEKLRNFDAEIVANANELLCFPMHTVSLASISIHGPAHGEPSVTGTPSLLLSRCTASAGSSIRD